MTEIAKVYAAISNVQKELATFGIEKGRRNQQQGYAFRGIDDVYNALATLLAKYRLVIIPRLVDRSVSERETQKGGTLFSVVVTVEYDFVSAEDGSKHTAKVAGEAMDSGDKATNKAMSAAYKYLCLQTFCIPTEGDNDADASTPPEVRGKALGKRSAHGANKPPAGDVPSAAGVAADAASGEAQGQDVITEQERQNLYHVCRANGMTDATFKDMIIFYGFKSSKDVTREVYEEILEKMKGAA
jgi:hypothetical protein